MSGAAHLIASHVADEVRVINAGDGRHEHPTQQVLDCFTIRRVTGAWVKGGSSNLVIAIVGDILHSRVARSDIHAFNTLGVGELRVVGPRTLLPNAVETLGVQVFHDPEAGLCDADVIIMLRLQNERMQGALLPSALEYFKTYGLTPARLLLAKPDVVVMHPGPINRGVEIDSAVADGNHSLILEQVSHGIAVRMAVMSMAMGNVPGARRPRTLSND